MSDEMPMRRLAIFPLVKLSEVDAALASLIRHSADQGFDARKTGDDITSILIDQGVDVHSHPPGTQNPDGSFQREEHVHRFGNLIPACEFAVSLAKEGHLNISVYPEPGPVLELSQARRIVEIWESGEVPFEVEEIEF